MITKRRHHWGWLVVLALFAGCAGGVGDSSDPNGEPCAGGKCDGVLSGDFIDLFKDPRSIGSGDLTKIAADLVTDQLNDVLANVPLYQPRLQKTELYALQERAEGSLTLKSLTALSAGLTSALGEQDFATRVNSLRQKHLETHPSRVWAEARFTLPSDPSLGVSVDAFGDSVAALRFGFTPFKQDIDATVIAPYDADKTSDLAKALVDAPARAVLAALGGLPSTLDDLRAMAPGQLIALHSSRGIAGFNLNGSTPIYLATIASHATIWARVSAAASVAASTELDVQLIRDEGERLVIDVGMTAHGDKKELNASYSLAVDGRWGVQALDLQQLALGPLSVDLGSIVRKTIQKQLDKRFTPFEAAIKVNPQIKTRHTVARYAFDLSPTLPAAKRAELRRAVALASQGVLYYAQVLARTPGSGVEEVLSVDRLARTPSFYIGAALPVLGMNFFSAQKKNVGQATITIGSQTQQLFWNDVERSKGWFFTERDYRVTGLASVRSVRGIPVEADHNLRLRLIEKQGNKASRDEILDHVDPLLVSFIGAEQLATLDAITGPLQAFMSKRNVCDSREEADSSEKFQAERDDKACYIARTETFAVQTFQSEARKIFAGILASGVVQGGFDTAFDRSTDFARQLFELKLLTQTLPEVHDFGGPQGKMRVEARLSAAALSRILAAPNAAANFETALRRLVYELNRRRSATNQADQQADIQDDHEKAIKKVVKRFRKAVQGYVTQRSLGRLSFLGANGGAFTVGDHGLLVAVGEDGKLAEQGEGVSAPVATIAERKAAALVSFFEDLVEEATPSVPLIGRLFGGLGTTEHQILTYTLLRLAHPWELELLVDLRFEDAPFIALPNVALYGRGAQAKLIDAGRFDLDTLISAP